MTEMQLPPSRGPSLIRWSKMFHSYILLNHFFLPKSEFESQKVCLIMGFLF